ncbi:MAG TPA: hypothetical protein VHX14_09820, partial [Thermoanaerobaculia bacterium]|nr:hypothetical protein [Thermoanaerobaculia bacterium]
MAVTANKNRIILATFVVLLGGIGGALWLLSRLPATIAALVAGGAGFLVSKLYESWKESKQRLHDKKREVYAKLLAPILALHLQILKPDKDRPAHEVILDQ